MSLCERLFHALLFEALAILLSLLGLTYFTSHETALLSGVVIGISLIAVGWNLIFNVLFDRIFTGPREQRSWRIRLLHTLLFEGGLLLFTLPLIMGLLHLDLLTALMMDIGMTLFIVVYTFLFNLCYDHTRAKLIAHRATRSR